MVLDTVLHKEFIMTTQHIATTISFDTYRCVWYRVTFTFIMDWNMLDIGISTDDLSDWEF